jgi:hypothetical protein
MEQPVFWFLPGFNQAAMNTDIPISTSLDDIPEEFLLPEQRLDAIADILATITKRVIIKRYAKHTKH